MQAASNLSAQLKVCLGDDQEAVFSAKPRHTSWESTGQEATRQVRHHAHKGIFPRERPVSCMLGVPMPAISPNARNLTSSFVIMASSTHVLPYEKEDRPHPTTLVSEGRLGFWQTCSKQFSDTLREKDCYPLENICQDYLYSPESAPCPCLQDLHSMRYDSAQDPST